MGTRTEPSFDRTPDNVTAFSGQNVFLPCTVNHLGKHKVVWLDQNSFPLTFDERRVIDDLRFNIIRPYIRDWNLGIRGVRPTDTGHYMCTVNTDPVLTRIIHLDVKVSPRFVDQLTNQLVVAEEGETVVLLCNVTGKPEPEVTWQRRLVTGGKLSYAVESLAATGSQLVIINATRHIGHLYYVHECLASNGVPPAVSRQIRLAIQYAPELRVNFRSVWRRRGEEVTLECTVSAFPLGDIWWQRRHRRLIVGSSLDRREVVERIERAADGAATLRVSIRDLRPVDFGDYTCFANNTVGGAKETISLVERTDSENPHLATASKRESALQLMTPTRSASPEFEVKPEKSSSPSRLTVPTKSVTSARRVSGRVMILLCCSILRLRSWL